MELAPVIAKIIEKIFDLGYPGIVILVLAGVIIFLWKHLAECNNALRKIELAMVQAINNNADATRSFTIAQEGSNRAMEARTLATDKIADEVKEARHEGRLARQEILGVVSSYVSAVHRGQSS